MKSGIEVAQLGLNEIYIPIKLTDRKPYDMNFPLWREEGSKWLKIAVQGLNGINHHIQLSDKLLVLSDELLLIAWPIFLWPKTSFDLYD